MDQFTMTRRANLFTIYKFGLGALFAVFGFIVMVLSASPASAVSGPTPTPGFAIVTQVCKTVGTETERQLDGYDTTVTENEDGTTTTTRTPRYKNVVVTITKCEWVERKVSVGQGIWDKRPELLKTVPCDQIDFFGIPEEDAQEFCEGQPDIIELPARDGPRFSDPDAETAYMEVSALQLTGAYRHIVDPSTVGISTWPCWLTAIDNSNPTLEIIDSLSIDKIDWAKFVNYKLTRYQQGSVTFRSPNTEKRLLVSKEGPVALNASGQPMSGPSLQFINTSGFASTAEWLSCKSATGSGGGGGVQTVTVSCPVYYNDIQVDGPFGQDLPALMEEKQYDPNSVRGTALLGKEWTEFGKPVREEGGQGIWKSLIQPRTYSGGAQQAIDIVRSCGSLDKAILNHRLPYLGNYKVDADLYFTTCSYSLMPGFANGAYFGGCTGRLTTKAIDHTYHASCSGIVRPGYDNVNSFDAAGCFRQTCVWSNDNTAFVYGRDVPGNPPLTQHFDDQETVLLDPTPTPPGGRSDGTAIIWEGVLDEMIVRDSGSNRVVGEVVEDTKFSVFEIDPDSTPWNPDVAKNSPNHRDQWFKGRILETDEANPFAFVRPGTLPKNVSENKRFTDWNNLKINVYRPSLEGSPFLMKFHRVQAWVLPVKLGGFSTLSEYQLGAAPVNIEDRQTTLTCSTNWSAINYVGKRIQP